MLTTIVKRYKSPDRKYQVRIRTNGKGTINKTDFFGRKLRSFRVSSCLSDLTVEFDTEKNKIIVREPNMTHFFPDMYMENPEDTKNKPAALNGGYFDAC